MKTKLLSWILIILLTAGCASYAAPSPDVLRDTQVMSQNELIIVNPQETPLPTATAQFGNQTQRIVIKNASLSVVVADPVAKIAEITTLAEEMGGWVVVSNSRQTILPSGEEAVQGNMTIRVSAERLDETLERIKSGVEEIESEQITGQDVTAQYVDLTSQVANLEAAEAQLQQIMESAQDTESVLQVYTELVQIRGDIERIQGQLNYYSEAAAYSSIQITLNPVRVSLPRLEVAGWRPGDTAQRALQSLIYMLQGIGDFLIVLVIFALPLAVIFGLPILIVIRWWRGRQKHSAR